MVTYPEDWREVKLGEALVYTQPTNYIENNYVEHGVVPVLTAGKSFILGYSDKTDSAYKNLPAILFDDFTTEVRYLDYPFMVKSSATKFLNLKSDYYDIKYLYYWLDNLKFQIEAHERHWISRFSKFNVVLPPLAEQQAIASALSDFDEHIDNLSELIEKKKAIRDGALENLISGKTRLAGFDKEVREYKPIKSVYKRVKGTPITAGTMNEINMSTGAIRVFAGGNTECRTNSDYLSNANIIREPIVIVQSRGVIDFIYCDEPCTFKNEMWGYTSLGISDVRFLFYYLKHNIEHFRNEGTGRSSFSQISLPVTEEYLIPVVSMKEQKEIVDILTAMDEEIESLKIEKEKMIQIKEGAMDDLLTGRVRLKV